MAEGKVGFYTDVEEVRMEMDGATNTTMRILVGEKEGAPSFIMRYFKIMPGGHSPYHSHDWEHENFVLKGRGKVRIGEKEYELKPGSYAFVPPNVMHQYMCDGDEPFEFLCFVPKHK